MAASSLYLEHADSLVIALPATSTDRGWPNHVRLHGPTLELRQPTFAMTEQPRPLTRDRLAGIIGTVDAPTMREVDGWLRGFLALP